MQSFLGNFIRIEIISVDEPPSTISLFLNAVLSSPNVCLQELIVERSEFGKLSVLEHGMLDGDALASISPALTAYGQLKTLELAICDYEAPINHVMTPLHHIIASQKVLECLSIDIHNFTKLDDTNLLHLLCTIFQNDAFHSLSVSGFAIPQDAFEEIVAAFFESTPSNKHSSLSFWSVTILEGKLQPGSVNTRRVAISQEQAEKFGRKKSLRISDPLPESFWKWFGTIPYICLESLRASCRCHGSDIQSHLRGHPSCRIFYEVSLGD